ncbi:MAG TPA: hypothetical protein VK543_08465 [Puia sp.]|nr:hypothetical protein [Puia sp.]
MRNSRFYLAKYFSVNDVQKRFSWLFPYLMLNFFKNRHDGNAISGQSVMYRPDVKIEEMKLKFSDGEFEISDSMTVAELENKLYDQFGLSAQVSRKAGNLWFETSGTNNWTLKAQNDHGREISPQQPKNPENFIEIPYAG